MRKIATSLFVLAISSIALAMDSSPLENRCSIGNVVLVIKRGDYEYGHFYSQLNLSLQKEDFTFKIAYDQENKKLFLSLDSLSHAKEARLGLPKSNSQALTKNSVFIFQGIPERIEIKEKSECLALFVPETEILFTLTRNELNELIK
jgi:hypothetical protein